MDWFTLAACMWLVVYGAIGYWRGLWHSLGSLLGLILAYFASVVLAGPCRDVLVKVLDSPNINPTLLYGASAAAIFIITGILMRIATVMAYRVLPKPPVKLDKASGAVVSGVHGVLLVSVIIWSGALVKETWAMREGAKKSEDIWDGRPPKVVQWSRGFMSSLIVWNARYSGASEPVAEISAVFFEHPAEVLQGVKQSVASTEFRQLINSEELHQLVEQNDVEGFRHSVEFQQLLGNDDVRAILHRIGLAHQEESENEMAERMVEIWRDVDKAKANPQIAELMNDREIQNFFNGDGKITASLLDKAQKFLTLISNQESTP